LRATIFSASICLFIVIPLLFEVTISFSGKTLLRTSSAPFLVRICSFVQDDKDRHKMAGDHEGLPIASPPAAPGNVEARG